MSTPDPIPAATLILFRERSGRPPELLMVERAAAMAFAGGALVFPGGRVDPADRLIEDIAGDPDDAAARVAAVRETLEEVGLAVGFSAPAPDLAAMREALAERAPFGALLAEHGLTLDLAGLVPFARWCPNFREARNFDTRFYVARAPAGSEPAVDGGETVAAHWATAAELLRAAEAGRHRLIFPTRRNLERLVRFASFEEAAADALAHPPRCITPWIEHREGEDWLCIPEDQGYPVTAERLETARRS